MIQVIHLHKSQIKKAGEVIARAFFDDPLSDYTWPDAAKRARPLWHQSVGMVRYGALYGETFTTSDVSGVAIWLKPGANDFNFWRLIRSGLIFSSFLYGREGFSRMIDVVSWAGEIHGRVISEPHWYLAQIGVQPEKQRQGIGRAVLAPMLARADAEHRACYLETMTECNVIFYERLRFKSVKDGKPPNGGPRTWFMVRRAE